MPTTETSFVADLLQGIGNRLTDIANDLNSDPNSPALAEVRAARECAERAEILLGKWVPHSVAYSHMHCEGDIVEHVWCHHLGARLTEDQTAAAVVEASASSPQRWVRVTMPGVVFLVEVDYDSVDDEDYSVRAFYEVRGRYPQ